MEKENRMEDIEKLEERVGQEKEKFAAAEHVLVTAMDKAYRLSAKLRKAGLSELKGANLAKVQAIVGNVNDAVSDAKCKVDCITLTGDVDTDAENLDEFGRKWEDALGEMYEAKMKAARQLSALAQKVSTTKRLDMVKVQAHVEKILSGLQYRFSSESVQADIDKNNILKNVSNLVQKSKSNQKLQTLVDWNAAGLNKNMKLFEMTLDDLEKLILHVRGSKD